ncbi:MAG: glycogen/starch/alpha-glucan family phosphorylase, partial [Firmicutes bacterium]|nr:glycogen/starch/alpha-glucan family phosphorylase [Bacillota bacterium]
YVDAIEVQAIPYDMMLSGYNAKTISCLKLWNAKSKHPGDMFSSRREALHHIKESKEIESINSVLYPSSETLRLKQQYFLCSASMQSIINWHVRKGIDLRKLNEYVAIHINDTHPTMCIPELMRILMDERDFSWDDAWSIVTKCVSYTNHTVMPEALETWEVDHIQRRVPRIHQIICEIDRRFRDSVARNKKFAPYIDDMAIVLNGYIRMANLAIIASHKVNGVAKIHSQILQDRLFVHFANMTPGKFINITNGVTPRRWLVQCNPMLTEFLTDQIGPKFIADAKYLLALKKAELDTASLKKINQIKLANKREFAKWLQKTQGITINPESRFDVQIKRIHEYKRQLMNVLRIIHLYNELKKNPNADVVPQTFIFSGKAASSYYVAKRIIKLATQVGAEIEKNEIISKVLKVVFVENFSVTVSEKLLPAIDVSAQISLAGQEASGTGNMKAVMNGALMLCTYDGANAEMCDQCHSDKIECSNFMFGLRPEEIEHVWSNGYHPVDIYNASPKIIAVIDALNNGFNGECFKDIASYLLGTSNNNDNYMCLADFESFIEAHEKMDALYKKPLDWARAVANNIGSMGYFSSDRSIQDYVDNIWGLTKLK